MKGCDVAVALEVRSIERENTLHRVDLNDGNQPSVINFDALDLVGCRNPLSHSIDSGNIGKERQKPFDATDLTKYLFLR
jgi:hypothetical protein